MSKTDFFGRTPTIRTHQEMVDRLKERTQVSGTGKLELARIVRTDGELADSKAGADPARTLPEPTPLQEAKPSELTERPVALVWGDVVRTGPSSGFQLSQGGAYSVVKTSPGVYEVWDRRWQPPEMIAAQKLSAAAARQVAQEHADHGGALR